MIYRTVLAPVLVFLGAVFTLSAQAADKPNILVIWGDDEWYRTPSGEAIFGEIGGRPPGAGLVDLINYASDIDTYTGWAECVVHGRFSQVVERRYNAAWIYKRARGEGRIQHYDGLQWILSEFGPHIVEIDLNPIGSPRRNWRQLLVGDGLVVVRHPDLATTRRMAEHIAAHLHIVAG